MSEARESTPPTIIRLHYVKSPHFRTVHVDGMIGGPSPNGYVNLAVFAERIPIPTSQVFALVDGRLGDEQVGDRTGREGIVRELEVNLVMSVDVARALQAWLGQNISKIESATASAHA